MTIAGGLCAVAGCGGAPLPVHAQTDAVAAVSSAEALGSTETPVAAYQLELARGEVRQAEAAVRAGHMEQARDQFELAKIDAELAMSLRREDQARTTSDAARSHIQELRQGEAVTSGGAIVPTSTTTTITTTQAQ